MTSQPVYVVRPRRLRVVALLAGAILCAATLIGWFALPADVRALFTVSQILTLLAVLAALVGAIGLAAGSYVRADEDGLTIRNGWRRHRVPWARVHKILLRRGDPWAFLLMKPADGRPFSADLDAERRMLMGIQTGDHERAQAAVAELRRRQRIAQG